MYDTCLAIRHNLVDFLSTVFIEDVKTGMYTRYAENFTCETSAVDFISLLMCRMNICESSSPHIDFRRGLR